MIRFGLAWATVFFLIPGEWTGMFTLTGLVVALAGCVRWYLRERRDIIEQERPRQMTLWP